MLVLKLAPTVGKTKADICPDRTPRPFERHGGGVITLTSEPDSNGPDDSENFCQVGAQAAVNGHPKYICG